MQFTDEEATKKSQDQDDDQDDSVSTKGKQINHPL